MKFFAFTVASFALVAIVYCNYECEISRRQVDKVNADTKSEVELLNEHLEVNRDYDDVQNDTQRNSRVGDVAVYFGAIDKLVKIPGIIDRRCPGAIADQAKYDQVQSEWTKCAQALSKYQTNPPANLTGKQAVIDDVNSHLKNISVILKSVLPQ